MEELDHKSAPLLVQCPYTGIYKCSEDAFHSKKGLSKCTLLFEPSVAAHLMSWKHPVPHIWAWLGCWVVSELCTHVCIYRINYIPSFFKVTWIDSPNGGHVFTPEKVIHGSKRGHDLKNMDRLNMFYVDMSQPLHGLVQLIWWNVLGNLRISDSESILEIPWTIPRSWKDFKRWCPLINRSNLTVIFYNVFTFTQFYYHYSNWIGSSFIFTSSRNDP